MVKSSTIQSLYIIYNSTVYLLIGQNLRSKGVWRNKETEVKVNFESNFVPNKNERVYKIHFLLQGCAAQPGLLGGAGKTAGCWNGEAPRLDNLQKYHMRHFPIDSHFHVFLVPSKKIHVEYFFIFRFQCKALIIAELQKYNNWISIEWIWRQICMLYVLNGGVFVYNIFLQHFLIYSKY